MYMSPLYQAIRTADNGHFALGALNANYIEPLLTEYLSHFSKLMELYQSGEEQNEVI